MMPRVRLTEEKKSENELFKSGYQYDDLRNEKGEREIPACDPANDIDIHLIGQFNAEKLRDLLREKTERDRDQSDQRPRFQRYNELSFHWLKL